MISETHDLYLLKTSFANNCNFVIYDMSYQYNTVYTYVILLSIQRSFPCLTFPFKLLELGCFNASLSLIFFLFKAVNMVNSFWGAMNKNIQFKV